MVVAFIVLEPVFPQTVTYSQADLSQGGGGAKGHKRPTEGSGNLVLQGLCHGVGFTGVLQGRLCGLLGGGII